MTYWWTSGVKELRDGCVANWKRDEISWKGVEFLARIFHWRTFPNINKEQYNFLYFSILNTFLNNIFWQGYFFEILYLTKERKYTWFITIEKGHWRVKYQRNPEDRWLRCVMVFIGSSKNGRDHLGIYHVLPRIKIISFVWFIVFLICFLLVFLEFFDFFLCALMTHRTVEGRKTSLSLSVTSICWGTFSYLFLVLHVLFTIYICTRWDLT